MNIIFQLEIHFKFMLISWIYSAVFSFDNVSVISECAESCKCDRKFNPVCGSDKLTHFSACHAGCQTVTDINGSITVINWSSYFLFYNMSNVKYYID